MTGWSWGSEVRVVYLKGDRALLRERLSGRRGHYMKESMLESQIATLEEPSEALVVDAGLAREEIVRKIRPWVA